MEHLSGAFGSSHTSRDGRGWLDAVLFACVPITRAGDVNIGVSYAQ